MCLKTRSPDSGTCMIKVAVRNLYVGSSNSNLLGRSSLELIRRVNESFANLVGEL